MERLAAAIILQALRDWEKSEHQTELEEFLSSSWFATLIEAAGLDVAHTSAIRDKILSGQYERLPLRASYR
jgi:hypothetical protein